MCLKSWFKGPCTAVNQLILLLQVSVSGNMPSREWKSGQKRRKTCMPYLWQRSNCYKSIFKVLFVFIWESYLYREGERQRKIFSALIHFPSVHKKPGACPGSPTWVLCSKDRGRHALHSQVTGRNLEGKGAAGTGNDAHRGSQWMQAKDFRH